MSTTQAGAPAIPMDVAPAPRMLYMQARALLVGYLRTPAFSVTTIALPVMFFAFFGLPNASRKFEDGTSLAAYLLASMGAYAVSSVMVFSFGIGVATSRGQKIDLLQRATPLPAWVSIVATVVNAMVFALLALLTLFLFAFVAAGVRLDALSWLQLTFRLLLGALPLLALGMAIGYSSGPSAAPAVTNLVYLPLAFASGLFIPIEQMPDFVQRLGPFLPTYHYGQLAWDVVGHAAEPLGTAVMGLAVWGVVLFAMAARAYRLDEVRKFA